MNYRVDLLWKVVTELTPDGSSALKNSRLLFNLRSGKGFLRSIGGKIRTSYAPVVLEPTVYFHQALSNLRDQLGFKGKKFPYEITNIYGIEASRLNVTLHLYDRVLCLTFSLDEVGVDANVDFTRLQKIESHESISAFIRQVLTISVTGNPNAAPTSALPKYYPAIRIVSLQSDKPDYRRDLVALLTRHPLPSDDVVAAVLAKNRPHQVDHSLVLLDKQGVVCYVPALAQATERGNMQRFKNVSSMLEFTAVLRFQLTRKYVLPVDVQEIISYPSDAIPESVSAQLTWGLITKEFQLPAELARIPVDVLTEITERLLVVTVTHIEGRAVLDAFAAETGRSAMPSKIQGYVYQHLGIIQGCDIYLAISEMGSGGTGGSQEAVRRSIDAIKPTAVVMVGIAFGINKKKFSVGDILVSKQLLLYELQRVNQDCSIVLRGDKPPASDRLLNWVRMAALTWPNVDKGRVEPGLILSGEKLIDNQDYRSALAKIAPDALGGEMEGAGLYATCQNAKVDWILIKAICDWADGNKSKNKAANQQKAAANASAFLLHLLNSKPELRDLGAGMA